MNFGRINYDTQKRLLKRLPYAVDVMPSLISIVPGSHPEIVDFMGDRSPNAEMTDFLRISLEGFYRNITSSEFLSSYN